MPEFVCLKLNSILPEDLVGKILRERVKGNIATGRPGGEPPKSIPVEGTVSPVSQTSVLVSLHILTTVSVLRALHQEEQLAHADVPGV